MMSANLGDTLDTARTPEKVVLVEAGHDGKSTRVAYSARAADEATVKQWVLDNTPAYQHPRWVEFVSAMPLAGTNKIDRAALRRQAEEIAAGGRR